MMLYPPMKDLLNKVPSRYKLVNVVAARARQIAAQAESQDIMLEDKPVSIAIQEIAQGKLPQEPAEAPAEPAAEEEEETLPAG